MVLAKIRGNSSSSTGENCSQCDQRSEDHCHGCGQCYCKGHFSEHQTHLQNTTDDVLHSQDVLNQNLKSIISQLSPEDILESIETMYEFKMKSKDLEKTVKQLQKNLQETQQISNGNGQHHLEDDLIDLEKDLENLRSKLDQIGRRKSDELVKTSSQIDVPVTQEPSMNETRCSVSSQKSSTTSQGSPSDCGNTLSQLLLKLTSPSIIDFMDNDADYVEGDGDIPYDDDKETFGLVGTSSSGTINHKIHFSNNIVSWLRGPLKLMVDGTIHAVEVFARETDASEKIVRAVEQGLARQKQMTDGQSDANNNDMKPVYTEVTSEWTFEGENDDKGFSSPSFWMRDPDGRRFLVKLQDHPLGAANEWLAYVLGVRMGLSVNQVFIAIHENKLVSLHADVMGENEKVITFMDLPKPVKKSLIKDPVMGSMDIFDHIIQNVDRNPRNILITYPSDGDLEDENTAMKMHLIDHTACFGLGKLNAISIFASKLHSEHLAVVKFDPVDKAKKFEQFLTKIPVTDRLLIRKTLNRFAAIPDEQFATWLIEIQDFLSKTQYERIRDVLQRQRDVAKRYTIQWGIDSRLSSPKTSDANLAAMNKNEEVMFF